MPFESIVPPLLLKNLSKSASVPQDPKTSTRRSNVICQCRFIPLNRSNTYTDVEGSRQYSNSLSNYTQRNWIVWKHVSNTASLSRREGHPQEEAAGAHKCRILPPELVCRPCTHPWWGTTSLTVFQMNSDEHSQLSVNRVSGLISSSMYKSQNSLHAGYWFLCHSSSLGRRCTSSLTITHNHWPHFLPRRWPLKYCTQVKCQTAQNRARGCWTLRPHSKSRLKVLKWLFESNILLRDSLPTTTHCSPQHLC